MKGRDDLFTKVKNLVLDKHKDIKFENIENGFQFKIEKFPYIFKIMCYEQIGWNVYLAFVEEEELVEHPETDELYLKIENIVDEVNYYNYGLDENIKSMVDDNFKRLEVLLEKYSNLIKSKERIELKYFIEFDNIGVVNTTPKTIVKYSISQNKWICSIENFYEEDQIRDELFDVFNDISLNVQEFNKQIDSLDYYF